MKKYFTRFILVSVILIIFGNAANAALPAFPSVFFFGDSLTDKGNFVATNPIPCVNVSAPVTNTAGGAFPGMVWADFLLSRFGIAAAATPGSVSNPSGNDWAVAGAQTKDVLTQVQNFVNVRGGSVNPSALYVIWAGSDDILDKLFFANPPADPRLVISQGMSEIVAIMTTLAQAGAKNFLVLNIPDISAAPLDLPPPFPAVTPAQRAQLKQVVIAWNNALASRQPTAGLGPLQFIKQVFKVNIFLVDTFSALDQVVTNPAGFPSGAPNFLPTITLNSGATVPNNTTSWCPAGTTANPNPDNFIFFNFVHPTANGHRTIFQFVLANADQF